ncbi:MAG: FtsQ-type POTRA domain-containing protein [Clostridia bacterium]|nr:FtsQ-type POTRA domain-containing protein [Clostridia bacterium]
MASRRAVTDINIYRNQRRRHRNVRWVLVPVFMVVCLAAGYFFAISGFFALDRILVEGNEAIPSKDIISLSRLERGMNIFAADGPTVQMLLSIEPRLKSVEMVRRIPNTIRLIVTERQPVALLHSGKIFLELDSAGRILDRYGRLANQSGPDSRPLPLLSGIDTTGWGLMPGCFLKGEQIKTGLAIIDGLPESAGDIGEINVADLEFIKLYSNSGLEIRLGDSSDLEEKYLLYSAIITENTEKSGPAIKYIDVSIKNKPAFAYVADPTPAVETPVDIDGNYE